MAVKSYTQEIQCPVSASRMFKAFCVDAHNFFPKVLPAAFNGVEYVQGDCVAVGSVQKINYIEDGVSKFVKHEIEELDVEKFYYKYSVIEGEIISGNIERVVVEEKFEETSTGCVGKIISHFHTKGNAEVDEEKLKLGKEKMTLTFNCVVDYLKANPNQYA